MKRTGNFLKYGMASCRRQIGRYFVRFLMSVLSLTILLVFFAWGAWAVLNAHHFVGKMGDAYHVSVYLKPDVDSEKSADLEKALCAHLLVKKCEYRNSDNARKHFVQRHPDLDKTIQSIQSNPFPASVEIDLNQGKGSYDEIARMIASIQSKPEVESVETSLAWLGKWERAMTLGRKVMRVVGLLILLVIGLILMNTMALLVLFHKDEIEVLDLMGADEWVMMLPFLMQSLCVTACAVSLALGSIYLFHVWVQNAFSETVIQWFGAGFVFFQPGFLVVFSAFVLVFAVISGWASCKIVMRRP